MSKIRSIRLLLVEDDHIDIMALRRFVEDEKLPYDITVAETVAEARAKLREGDIELALVDYSLPDGTGMELLEEHADIPCVFITSSTDPGVAVEAMKSGASDFLTKDTDRNYLRLLPVTLERALAGKAVEVRIARYQEELEGMVSKATSNLERVNRALRTEVRDHGRAEAALEITNERLEKTLEELSRTQAKVVQQERLAAVGQMAAGIAHDFNNILAGIQGYAELVQDTKEISESVRESMDQILGLGERAALLIRQILDFGRKSVSQPESLDLGVILKEIVEFLRHTIPERVDIRVEMEDDQFPISADPTQLQQVFTNLAVNARDAMPGGGKLVFHLAHFVLGLDDEVPCIGMVPGAWVATTVKDEGSGILPENLARIFEPFYTTKKRDEGTGLGLSQVYGIISQHGGSVSVESTLGEGTAFTLYLPSAGKHKDSSGESDTDEVPRGHGETILVVDDQPDVLQTCQAMLEYLGYKVLTAAEGEEALSVYNENKEAISAVLSDVVMPGMDGTALRNELLAQDPVLPVILMSGYPSSGQMNGGGADTVTGWIQKPVTYRKVAKVMNQAIHG